MHFKRIAITATASLLLLLSVLGNSLAGRAAPAQKRLWATELLRAVEFYGLEVQTHAGGHGMGTKPHSDLVKNAGPDG